MKEETNIAVQDKEKVNLIVKIQEMKGWKLRLIVVVAVVLAFFGQQMVLNGKLSKAEKEAAQEIADLIEQYENKMDTIIVTPKIEVSNVTLREVVAPASKLVTYEYYYSDIGEYEKNRTFFNTKIVLPFTTDKTIYTYTGVIGMGLQMEDVEFDIDEENKAIIAHMPQLQILSHTCEEEGFRFYDVKNSVFTSTSLGEFQEFEAALKETQEEKLLAKTPIWDSARRNAELVVTNLLTMSGQLGDYTLQYDWTI